MHAFLIINCLRNNEFTYPGLIWLVKNTAMKFVEQFGIHESSDQDFINLYLSLLSVIKASLGWPAQRRLCTLMNIIR